MNEQTNQQRAVNDACADHQALQAKEETATAVHRYGKDFYLSLLTEDTPHLAMVD